MLFHILKIRGEAFTLGEVEALLIEASALKVGPAALIHVRPISSDKNKPTYALQIEVAVPYDK